MDTESTRRAILRRAGAAAAGTVVGGSALAAATAPPAAAAAAAATDTVFDGQARWDSDDDHVGTSHLDINKPALVLRQIGEDHKGAMIEYQQRLEAGPHVAGVATNTPGERFDVANAGAKRVAWIVAHYDSPNPADGVHQHISVETCKADLATIITRFQISWGEDVALISFPNSNVRVIQSDKVLGFGTDSQVRAGYRSSARKLEFSGDPVTFERGQLQVADEAVSATTFVRKPSAQSRTNTATPADDAHLRVALAAGATYTVSAFVVYRSHPDADLRVAWSLPAGASIRWTPGGLAAAGTGIVGPAKGSANGSEPVNLGGAGTDVPMAFAATGLVRTDDAGSIRLRWSQDRAHPSAATIEADSYLHLTRVG